MSDLSGLLCIAGMALFVAAVLWSIDSNGGMEPPSDEYEDDP
jgi:hypothetical protein